MEGQKKSEDYVSDLVTRKVAARRLSISTRTLDRMANKGLIEKVFVGGAVRFRTADIDKIVAEGI